MNMDPCDGLLASRDRLYVADISGHGGFGSSAKNSGAIYRIRYVGKPTVVHRLSAENPERFALESAFPNPFNPTTTIRFTVPTTSAVLSAQLVVYDLVGQRVKTLMDQAVGTGIYAATWDGTDANGQAMASGTYVYRLRIGDQFMESGRVTLIK